MAVNHADGVSVGSVFAIPLLASGILFSAGKGWLSIPCVIIALPPCLFVLYVVRLSTYCLVGVGLRFSNHGHSFWQQLLFTPVALLYFVLPPLGAFIAFLSTLTIAAQCVRLVERQGGWSGYYLTSLFAVAGTILSVVFWQRYFWRIPICIQRILADDSPEG